MRKFLALVGGHFIAFILAIWSVVTMVLDLLGRADVVVNLGAPTSIGSRSLKWVLETPWYVPGSLALIITVVWMYFTYRILFYNAPSSPEIISIGGVDSQSTDLARTERRRELVRQGRMLVQDVRRSGGGDESFRAAAAENMAFYELRKSLSPSFIGLYLQPRRGSIPGADGLTQLPVDFLKELDRLEIEWDLI
jgi:hypothetical protein